MIFTRIILKSMAIINLGLCCINNTLRKNNIFNSRTCIRRTYSVEKAKELALKNVRDLIPMIEWNNQNNIKCFRLASNLFPHFTDSEVESYTIDFAKPDLKIAGDLAKKYGMRILMHPGQFNQVGAKNPKVFQKTIDQLSHLAEILDAMGIDYNGVLIIHGGGMYGDKKKTMVRWVKQFMILPEIVRRRLVLEHCERCYSLREVLSISLTLKKRGYSLPVVFDSHHFDCYDELHPDEKSLNFKKLAPIIIKSWGHRRPLMHVSNQGSGRVGHHSDFITNFPSYFFHVRDVLGVSFDVEVEAKAKEAAIFALRDLEPTLE
jgi:UV DNA damage endonuclease